MNLNRIDLNQLKTFVVVYESGSVKAAAEVLCVTQPAVSNTLSRLRDVLQDPLFSRSGRGMEPTSKASSLYQKVRPALLTIQHSLSSLVEFDPMVAQRQFKCALSSYVDPFMPDMASVLLHEGPGLSMHRVRYDPVNNFEDLKNGKIDLMMMPINSDIDGIQQHFLFEERLVLAHAPDNPVAEYVTTPASCGALAFAELADEYQQIINRVLSKDGISYPELPQALISFPNFSSLIHLLASTRYVALVPERVLQRYRPYYDLEYQIPDWLDHPISLYIGWPESSEQDPAHHWFRERLFEVLQNPRTSSYSG